MLRRSMLHAIMIALLGHAETVAQGTFDPRVLRVTQDAHIFTDKNGDPDAGFMVKAIVQNRGTKARIVVSATLSCSEGEWTRRRTILLDTEETDEVRFGFPEPTIGAEDVKSIVRVSQ